MLNESTSYLSICQDSSFNLYSFLLMIPTYNVVICLTSNSFPWAKLILMRLLYPSDPYIYWTSLIVQFNLFPSSFFLLAHMYCYMPCDHPQKGID